MGNISRNIKTTLFLTGNAFAKSGISTAGSGSVSSVESASTERTFVTNSAEEGEDGATSKDVDSFCGGFIESRIDRVVPLPSVASTGVSIACKRDDQKDRLFDFFIADAGFWKIPFFDDVAAGADVAEGDAAAVVAVVADVAVAVVFVAAFVVARVTGSFAAEASSMEEIASRLMRGALLAEAAEASIWRRPQEASEASSSSNTPFNAVPREAAATALTVRRASNKPRREIDHILLVRKRGCEYDDGPLLCLAPRGENLQEVGLG
mmetsp:Transcript_9873/g.21707  ORF Transcript_9873/g.21707 Transcript_9873/m.21707 type:complete len:265 (+) Transcript_9873:471-1265(+)